MKNEEEGGRDRTRESEQRACAFPFPFFCVSFFLQDVFPTGIIFITAAPGRVVANRTGGIKPSEYVLKSESQNKYKLSIHVVIRNVPRVRHLLYIKLVLLPAFNAQLERRDQEWREVLADQLPAELCGVKLRCDEAPYQRSGGRGQLFRLPFCSKPQYAPRPFLLWCRDSDALLTMSKLVEPNPPVGLSTAALLVISASPMLPAEDDIYDLNWSPPDAAPTGPRTASKRSIAQVYDVPDEKSLQLSSPRPNGTLPLMVAKYDI
jgi:hypothetical protein